MLPDLRFLLGATLATALLGVVALGLATTVRLSHQAKVSPLEASRSLAFAERGDWNRTTDPELTRTFEALARTSIYADGDPAAVPSAPASAPPDPVAASVDQLTSAQPEPPALPQKAASVPATDTTSIEPVRETTPPAEQVTTAVQETEATAEQAPPSEAPPSASAETPAPDQSNAPTPANSQPIQAAETPIVDTPVVDIPIADPTQAATLASSEAPPDQAPTVEASGPAAEPKANNDVAQVARVETAAIANTVEEKVEEQNVIAPKAEPAKALHHPAPRTRRVIGAAAKAKTPKAKLAKVKPKAKAVIRARTAARQPTAWTGYPVTQQRPTSWGWGFNK